MALKLSEGASFTPAPVGLHNGICTLVVDLGMQSTPFGVKPKILLGWELPDVIQDDGRPAVVTRQFGATLSKQGSLRPIVDSWRGKPFTAEEAAGFDMQVLLGKPCKVLIQHAETKDGRTFANVAAVIKPDPGQPTTAVSEVIYFDMDQPDPVAKAKLPGWIVKLIEAAEVIEKPAPAPATPAPDLDDDLTF